MTLCSGEIQGRSLSWARLINGAVGSVFPSDSMQGRGESFGEKTVCEMFEAAKVTPVTITDPCSTVSWYTPVSAMFE